MVGGSSCLCQRRSMATPSLSAVSDKKIDENGRTDKFSNRGHRLVHPSTPPGERPKPKPPQPDKK